jgi:hypothetical protein
MADQRRPVPPPLAPPHSAATIPPAPPLTAQGPPAFQFSTRSLLIAVTLAAALSAFAGALGGRTAWDCCAAICGMTYVAAAPVCFGTLALYCRGMRQTFFLGALVGSVAAVFGSRPVFVGGATYYVTLMLVALATALACGSLAVATRRFAERRNWHVPSTPPGTEIPK